MTPLLSGLNFFFLLDISKQRIPAFFRCLGLELVLDFHPWIFIWILLFIKTYFNFDKIFQKLFMLQINILSCTFSSFKQVFCSRKSTEKRSELYISNKLFMTKKFSATESSSKKISKVWAAGTTRKWLRNSQDIWFVSFKDNWSHKTGQNSS